MNKALTCVATARRRAQGWPRVAACLLALGLLPSADLHAQLLLGVARDARTHAPLYTELHDVQRDAQGHLLHAHVHYFNPAGVEIARKQLDYGANPYIPAYRLDMLQLPYSEGIAAAGARQDPVAPGPGDGPSTQSKAGQIDTFKSDGQALVHHLVPRQAQTLQAADAGFNALLVDRFAQLREGHSLPFDLVVAGRGDHYRFSAKLMGRTRIDGQPAWALRVEPDSLLRWLVDPIDLVYDDSGRQLLRYEGVSNLIDAQSSRVYPRVQIIYVTQLPPDFHLPPAQMQEVAQIQAQAQSQAQTQPRASLATATASAPR